MVILWALPRNRIGAVNIVLEETYVDLETAIELGIDRLDLEDQFESIRQEFADLYRRAHSTGTLFEEIIQMCLGLTCRMQCVQWRAQRLRKDIMVCCPSITSYVGRFILRCL